MNHSPDGVKGRPCPEERIIRELSSVLWKLSWVASLAFPRARALACNFTVGVAGKIKRITPVIIAIILPLSKFSINGLPYNYVLIKI